jgi:hypothetical protein
MDTITGSNPHFAEGRQYPQYLNELFPGAGDKGGAQ